MGVLRLVKCVIGGHLLHFTGHILCSVFLVKKKLIVWKG